MKKLLLLIITFIFLTHSSMLFSQSKTKLRENSLKDGKWALLFAIGENFKLTKLDGLTISVKKHISDANALRLGVSVTFDNSDGTGNQSRDTNNYPSKNTSTEYSVALYPTYYMYLAPKADVNVYFGLGLFGGYNYAKFETTYYSNPFPEVQEHDDHKSESFSFGINSSLGVEFFPIRSFSIFAEYSIGFGYTKSQSNDIRIYYEEVTRIAKEDGSSKNFKLFNNNVNLGLAVYF